MDDALSKQIIQGTKEILADGKPRTGREIALLLGRFGLAVHKSLVEKTLSDQGEPEIIYDQITQNFFLSEHIQDHERSYLDLSLEDKSIIAVEISSHKQSETTPASSSKPKLPNISSALTRPHTDLSPQMIVRVPIDTNDYESDFRDFRIGHIIKIDSAADQAQVQFLDVQPDQTTQRTILDYPLQLVARCRIMPGTKCLHTPTNRKGIILIADQDKFPASKYIQYHVLLDGCVQQIPEDQLMVPSHRQDPNPLQQLQSYEFHNPIWKSTRDTFVTAYRSLKTATFGVEDLVSSRVLLMAHQAETITRVLSDDTCRYILADEVGLGKTIEACVILKGLLKRYGEFKTLLVAPAALLRQWYNELDTKFWLTFTSYKSLVSTFGAKFTQPGLLVATEQLKDDEGLWEFLQLQPWGLVIVDEAHHIRKQPTVYQRIHQLSAKADRALILSATPIQRRGDELFDLLRLMDPERYRLIPYETFQQILDNQRKIRETVIYNIDVLTPDLFENEDFSHSLQQMIDHLPNDRTLVDHVTKVKAAAETRDQGLQLARQTLAYLSENYRIESRMIRNRRANLDDGLLPSREVDTSYTYNPSRTEQTVLQELHVYLQQLVEDSDSLLEAELSRLMLHAAASSPSALLSVLRLRERGLTSQSDPVDPNILLRPATPRHEITRIEQLCNQISPKNGEEIILETVISLTEQWATETEHKLEQFHLQVNEQSANHRPMQVLRAISDLLTRYPAGKIVVFSAWCETLELLRKYLTKAYSARSTAEFHSRIPQDELDLHADRFQADEDCHFILCDELGGEGRNFQFADAILHVDLPWTPAQIEQRIGRVDRLGRDQNVRSIVIYALGETEEDLFRLWQHGLELFSRSMSGLEIAIEGILDEILDGIKRNPREALARLLPKLSEQIVQLREEVDQERLFEYAAIDTHRRREFDQISEQFRDGEDLRIATLKWANLAGLENRFAAPHKIVSFKPKQFNWKSISNAKFFRLPNMEDALARSRRKNKLEIQGTFDRMVGVQREDLVFFAPGEPWTDSIIANALEADRGRCAAVCIETDIVDHEWRGFEFLYSIEVDPRPLYRAGFMPVHLYHAQGYLMVSTYRIVVDFDGENLPISHSIHKLIAAQSSQLHSRHHLGRRGSGQANVFRELYPPDIWENAVTYAQQVAFEIMSEEFSFMEDEAQIAAEQFERQAMGLQAQLDWLSTFGISSLKSSKHIINHRTVSDALEAGIRQPHFQLESATYWLIKPQEKSDG